MSWRKRLWNPYALVFVSSVCVMVIELVASRLIAPRVGVSLYTWTSVIGVILAGMALGNYIGGRLADRRASTQLLGVVYALAALATLAILWLNNDLHDVPLPQGVPLMVWIILYVTGLFFVPSLILGCVSPIVVKLSLTDMTRTGRTVGKIYAWSTAGSIVGTFATGFWLISWFGTKSTILGVCGVLLLLAVWFLSEGPWRKTLWRVAVLLVVFGLSVWLLSRTGYLKREYVLETNYFAINVIETDKEGRAVRELILDRLVHSYTDMDDPTHLEYAYEKTYAGIIAPLLEAKPESRLFFVGGGGYTFPRYLEVTAPETELVVTEIDPGVTDVAHSYLGLPRDTRIKTYNMDARNYMSWYAAPGAFDVVFGDAFNDFSVPYHLTTLEFAQLVARSLAPDGLYLANIIDGGPNGHFFRAFVRTLRRVFPEVVVIPSADSWRTSPRTTFVVAASRLPLDLSHVPSPYVPLIEDELQAYLGLEAPLYLTDDYVPVDNLMAPVAAAADLGQALEGDWADLVRERIVAIGGFVGLVFVGIATWFIIRRRRADSPAS